MDKEFTKVLENFGIKLFSGFIKSERYENIIFSPFSIQTCLTMARMGASGKTAIEMDKGLGLNNRDIDEDELAENYHTILKNMERYTGCLTIANKIYVNQVYKIQRDFDKIIKGRFLASVESINCNDPKNAADYVNKWVESKTNSLIKDLISPEVFSDNPLNRTGMVLINAIYFKGNWEYPFLTRSTQKEDFYLTKTETVKVDMMCRDGAERFNYGEFPELNAVALELPYKRSDLSMIIILPKSYGLFSLERKLKSISIQDLKKRMSYTKVLIKLPKFKAEYEVELTETFKKLGMKRMFSKQAEFGKCLIVEPGDWSYISNIMHKAVIDVNEHGTEAAAATYIRRCGGGNGPVIKDPEFIANQPFFYVIQNSNGIVFFKGHVRKFA